VMQLPAMIVVISDADFCSVSVFSPAFLGFIPPLCFFLLLYHILRQPLIFVEIWPIIHMHASCDTPGLLVILFCFYFFFPSLVFVRFDISTAVTGHGIVGAWAVETECAYAGCKKSVAL